MRRITRHRLSQLWIVALAALCVAPAAALAPEVTHGAPCAARPASDAPPSIDPSLVRGLAADAPDPDDPAEPPGLQARLLALVESRRAERRAARTGPADHASAREPAIGSDTRRQASLWRPAPAPSSASQEAEALSAAIDVDYLHMVTERVSSFGDNPDGWRPGGSPADEAAVDWIADEMRRIGMVGVTTANVPIDRWVFNGAAVAVDGGPVFEASSWGGVPGTPPGGIHAQVLDLGLGRQAEYDALPGDVDVAGKIVLVNWAFGDWWVNRHGHQATLEGAAAVIFYTGTTAGGAFYNTRDDSLFAFDGTYDDDWVPFVFVTRNAANDLLARIAQGPTFVTLTSNVELTRAEDGGYGRNIFGMIPGSDLAEEPIIFTGHHDAWFSGAADDATAIAAMLGIGRAIRDTGFVPRHSLVFLPTTSEEYGYTDSYYEWLIGAWYAVTHQRPDWGDSAALSLDFELLGTGDPGERLLIRTHSELFDLANARLTADPDRTPFGTAIQNTVWANADHFTLTAAGIPGVYFNTVGIGYLTRNYHTDHDTLDRINVPYLKQNIEVINDVWVGYDRAELPPLDFVARAVEAESRIAFVVDGRTIRDLPGVVQPAQDYLEEAVARFRRAAEALDRRIERGPLRNPRAVARAMRKTERILLTDLVALDNFDQYIFPHQQLQRDATRMQAAIDALESDDPVTALDFVRRTGLTNAGRHFAYETYVAELARHDREFDRLQWGGQAHLAPYVDVWQEYHAIAGKIAGGLTAAEDYAPQIESLRAKLYPVYLRLNGRLIDMGRTFDRAARTLEPRAGPGARL